MKKIIFTLTILFISHLSLYAQAKPKENMDMPLRGVCVFFY
jgi:hypothetical protein